MSDDDWKSGRDGAALVEAEALVEMLRSAMGGKSPRGVANTLLLALAVALTDNSQDLPIEGPDDLVPVLKRLLDHVAEERLRQMPEEGRA